MVCLFDKVKEPILLISAGRAKTNGRTVFSNNNISKNMALAGFGFDKIDHGEA